MSSGRPIYNKKLTTQNKRHWSACINNLVDEIEEDASLAKYSMGDRYTLKFYHSAAEMLAAG